MDCKILTPLVGLFHFIVCASVLHLTFSWVERMKTLKAGRVVYTFEPAVCNCMPLTSHNPNSADNVAQVKE